MTAQSLLLRTLSYSLAPDPETGLPRYDAGAPDIWGHVDRFRLGIWVWEISAGEHGACLGHGEALTKKAAWRKAYTASHRPGIEREARKAVSR